jgi:hypothetical protein
MKLLTAERGSIDVTAVAYPPVGDCFAVIRGSGIRIYDSHGREVGVLRGVDPSYAHVRAACTALGLSIDSVVSL